MMTELTSVVVNPIHRILDVGFGMGGVIVQAAAVGCAHIAGVDIAEASIHTVLDKLDLVPRDEEGYPSLAESLHYVMPSGSKISLALLDVSHDCLPFDDNSFDIAFCTETIEHLSNPFFAVSEIKRVLVPDGLFILAFPQPARNLGYDGGQHAHCYPGFLLKDSFMRFMRQLYFRACIYRENGASDWSAWRNYKGPGQVDVFHMISGNYTEKQLYECLDP